MNTENNRIIAEFLGATQNNGVEYEMYGIIQNIEDELTEKHFFFASEMLFDKDWNWLMEAVKEINNTGKSGGIKYALFNALGNADLETAYIEVVGFIKWHNEQK